MISRSTTVHGSLERVSVEDIQKSFNTRPKDDTTKVWWSANPKPTSF